MIPVSTVARIVDELEDPKERISAIRELATADELLQLAHYYNWDDGMQVPSAIIDHPACDLGVALHLFELAEGTYYLSEERDWKYQEAWAAFCHDLSNRIQSGHYTQLTVPFESALTAVQRFKLTKAGVPPVFFTSVTPNTV
ncbi:MAG: DUF4274 domain-containing protein [Planctomycetaceae bacterium]|nr:DUF4274 domain-containing protein [Planctomycetaceae bacterium]